jgi:hypothetical protein
VETINGIELWAAPSALGERFAVRLSARRARLINTLAGARRLFDETVRQHRAARAD